MTHPSFPLARTGTDLPSPDAARPRAVGGAFASVASAVFPADLGLDGRTSLARTRPTRSAVHDVVLSERLPTGRLDTETLLEAAAVRQLACDPAVSRILPRCHVLVYAARDHEGRERRGRIVPDMLAVRRDGSRVAIRLAPSWEGRGCDATDRAIRAAYGRHGIVYRVWTEFRPFAKAPRWNRVRMLRERAGPDAPALVAVRCALPRADHPRTAENVRRRAGLRTLHETLACLFELHLAGEALLDLRRPFDAGTAVRRGPVA